MSSDQYTLVFIGLGSNLQPAENISRALSTLESKLAQCCRSPVYRSPAVGMQGPDFYNAVLSGQTTDDIDTIRRWLRNVEAQQGRIRTDNKFTNRTLDLDLLFYGDTITDNLPHREVLEQAHVLQPLHDIAAELIHPVTRQTIQHIYTQVRDDTPRKFTTLTRVTLTL